MSHTTIAFTDIYPDIRRFWWLSIERNPGFYACVVIGLLILLNREFTQLYLCSRDNGETSNRERADRILCGYAFTLFALGIWHKQPWPYFFVLLIPTGFVVIVAAFNRVLEWSTKLKTVDYFVPSVRLLALLVFLSLIPQLVRATVRLKETNLYQASTIALASKLVDPGQYYFACTDLLYDRKQSSSILGRYSYEKRSRLRRADNAVVDQALRELKLKPPIVLLNNYRFRHLPRRIKRYLKRRYQPYWGSIDIYSPAFKSGRHMLYVDFRGRYEVSIRNRRPVRIRKRIVRQGEQIMLPKGYIRIESASAGRLRLQFDGVESLLDPRFRKRMPFFGNQFYER